MTKTRHDERSSLLGGPDKVVSEDDRNAAWCNVRLAQVHVWCPEERISELHVLAEFPQALVVVRRCVPVHNESLEPRGFLTSIVERLCLVLDRFQQRPEATHSDAVSRQVEADQGTVALQPQLSITEIANASERIWWVLQRVFLRSLYPTLPGRFLFGRLQKIGRCCHGYCFFESICFTGIHSLLPGTLPYPC